MEHSLLRIEQKPWASTTFNPEDNEESLSEKITRCSICCRFLWENSWLQIEDFSVIKKKSLSQLSLYSVDYSLCLSCSDDYNPVAR